MDTWDLGQIAYEAYKKNARDVSLISGDVLPIWADLPENIKIAWRAAGDAVALSVKAADAR